MLRPHHDRRNGLAAQKAVFTKAAFWEYEQEWRILNSKGGPRTEGFPPELLDGVILGAKISSEHEATIRRWVRKRGVPTELLRARIDETFYRIRIENADARKGDPP